MALTASVLATFAVANLHLLALCVGIIYISCIVVYRLFYHPLSRHPGPLIARLTDAYVSYHSFRGDIHKDIRRCHEKYGTIFRYGPNRLVSGSLEDMYEIYSYGKPFKKATSYETMIPWPGGVSSATALDRDLHRDLRRNISSGFSNDNIKKFEPAILENLEIYIRKVMHGPHSREGWGPSVESHSWNHWLALDTMAQLGFGTRTQLLERPDRRYILKLLHIHAKKLGIYEGWPALNNIGLGGFVSRFMATMVPTVRRFNKWHHGFTASAVANSSNTPGGVFAPLIRGSGTPGKSNYFKRSHEQMVAEGSFVTLTGGDGYALTLSTLYFYLSHYPECQDRLAQELRAQFPEADVITSGPKLANCVYLRACIIEAMRMVPPASNVPWRECESGNSVLVGDSQIEKQRPGSESGVVQIPIGTDVGVSPYTIFRRKDIFREPARFWPERWLDPAQGGVIADDGERYRARQACKPFSIGPRNCSGQQVAMTMASVGVANILRDFEIRLADDKPDILKKVFEDGRPELDFELHFFTMWKEGPWVQFRSRGDSASAIGRS